MIQDIILIYLKNVKLPELYLISMHNFNVDSLNGVNEDIICNLKISTKLKQIRNELNTKSNYKHKNFIKKLVNVYPYNISGFLKSNKLINFVVSNAFTKLYEILHLNKCSIFTKNTLNAYHMAEAPGQWIKCIEFYIKKKKLDIEYEWYANTLNPDNEENIKKYNILFDDKYDLIKTNNKKWLFGKDDTGDITNVDNIIHIKNLLLNRRFNLDLITSDAGIDAKSTDYYFLQKLDFAQYVNVLMLSSKGTNVIIKTFLPFISSKEESYSKDSIMFYISILYGYIKSFESVYLYKPLTSNFTSGEYYIIGLKYKDSISDTIKKKLLNTLLNFEVNVDFMNYKTIPNNIIVQACIFFNNILEYNNKFINVENIILQLILKNKFTDDALKSINSIKSKALDYWLHVFNFGTKC